MGEVQSGKSLAVAYVLWLVGGFFGAHHMYLGNDTRAFWVVCTVGALGLGWLRDAWCLPSYVRSVNDPQLNEAALTPRRRSFFLMLALFVGSFVVTRLVGLALAPQSLTPWWWLAVVHAAAAALAARWVLGSSYHCATSASLLGTLAAAAAGQVVVLALPNLDRFPVASFIPSPAGASALGASVWVYRHRVWVPWASAPSRTASSRSLCARVVWLGFAVTAAVALLLASFVFNATLVVNGKQLSVAECLTRLDEVGLDEWSAAVTRWLESLDEWERITVRGTARVQAYSTLGLKEGASMSEVRRRFRQLAMELHPDRHPDEDRRPYEAQFAEVQEAYHLLVERYGRSLDDREL